jgi:hypothetical protein
MDPIFPEAVSVTCCPERLSVAVGVPSSVGRNCTATEQVACGDSEEVQVLPTIENSGSP